MMADWTCRCSAKNAEHDRYCEGCSAENPKAVRVFAPAPKVPETNAPWVAPTYPAPAPGDDALIRAEMARWREQLGLPPKPEATPSPTLRPGLGLAIDPAIRAELDRRNATGPEPVGALLPPALKRATP